jgi:hypothetical protein
MPTQPICQTTSLSDKQNLFKMKKIQYLLIPFFSSALLFSCSKETDASKEFEKAIADYNETDLDAQYFGTWRWIRSQGGWGGQFPKDGETRTLTIRQNKTYTQCFNQDCGTARWFYGFNKLNDAQRLAAVLIMEATTSDPKAINHPEIMFTAIKNDTLWLSSANCIDCMNPVFVRVK